MPAYLGGLHQVSDIFWDENRRENFVSAFRYLHFRKKFGPDYLFIETFWMQKIRRNAVHETKFTYCKSDCRNQFPAIVKSIPRMNPGRIPLLKGESGSLL